MSSLFLNAKNLSVEKIAENRCTRSVSQRLLNENVRLIEAIREYQSRDCAKSVLQLQLCLKRNLEFLSTVVNAREDLLTDEMRPFATVDFKLIRKALGNDKPTD